MKSKLAMLKVYLESEIKKFENGEVVNKAHHSDYIVGLHYQTKWVKQLLNEPATLKTYYDKAVGK